MKNVIVFGGCGFIGTNLCLRNIVKGNKVLCVDNMSSGTEQNLNILSKYGNFSFIMGDITDDKIYAVIYEKVMKWMDGNLDEIYNLACVASPKLYQKDPLQTLHSSLAVEKIIDFAEMFRGVKILHSSTSEVYGDPDEVNHPQCETYFGNVNMIGERSCYDEGKRCAETICHEYYRLGSDIRVVRIFNTCGEHMKPDDGRILTNFITQALNGEKLTVYGDGSQTRCFCYIDDLLDGFDGLMAIKERCFGPVNLGNPVEYTVLDVAKEVCKQLDYDESNITFEPLPSDDPKMRHPNIEKAKSVFGFEPKVSLNECINKMINYLRQ